jgi:hypothetical protein
MTLSQVDGGHHGYREDLFAAYGHDGRLLSEREVVVDSQLKTAAVGNR